MLNNNGKKESGNVSRGSIEKELAEPRMTKSAKIAAMNLEMERIPKQPSTTLSGTVEKIIPSPDSSQPEKAQIAVEGADDHDRDLRIQNTFIDENGDEVRLKTGAHVEVTVTAEAKK